MKSYIGIKANALRKRLSAGWKRKDSDARMDFGLPFGLRIGSRIQFSEAPFLLAELLADGEFGVGHPGDESLVAGYSEIEWAGLNTFRIYTRDRISGNTCLLLIAMGDDSAEEVYLFKKQTDIPLHYVNLDEVPADGDEVNAVDFWIDDVEGIIGMPLFHTPEELTYHRLWDSDNDVRIPPLAFQEKIHWDAYGENSAKVEHLGEVLYARTVAGADGELDEYLLPSVERDQAGFRVRVRVGMPLSPTDLSFPDALQST